MCRIELCDLAETNISVTVKKICTKGVVNRHEEEEKQGRTPFPSGRRCEPCEAYNRSGIRHIT